VSHGAAEDGEILRKAVHGAAVDAAPAGDDAFAQGLLGIVRRALDERINFNERAPVKKLLQALSGRLLARRPLLLHPPLATAAPAASPPLLQLLQLFRHGHVPQCESPPIRSARPRRPSPARARRRRR